MVAARGRSWLTALALAAASRIAAQSTAPAPAATPATLDAYVNEAMRANLGLAEQRLMGDRADVAVRQAHGSYLPSIGFDASYAQSSGYVLDFGKLVDPAYERLNQLTPSAPYPTNVDLRLPLTQQTGLHLQQPLYQPAISATNELARTQRDQQDVQVQMSERRLAADVRTAYLNLARATRVEALYRETQPLVAENVRVSERLVANGSAAPDIVLRAQAEQSDVDQQLAAAAEHTSAAREYFNLLLDRPADGSIDVLSDSTLAAAFAGPIVPLDEALRTALNRREEFRQIDLGEDATKTQERLASAGTQPSVAASIDYGIQGSEYRISGDRFAIATLNLQWNFFDGGQDAARRQEASIEGSLLRVQRRELERQVTLEVMQAREAAEVAQTAIATAKARQASAVRSFQLVSKRYAEGLATLVEFIDARTSATSAGINLIITTYDYYASRVEFDRAAALYPQQLPPPR